MPPILIGALAALLIILTALIAANYLINFAIRQPMLSSFWQDYIPHNAAALAALDGLRLRTRFLPAEGDGSAHGGSEGNFVGFVALDSSDCEAAMTAFYAGKRSDR